MGAAAAYRAATANQIAAWKKRNGHSIAEAAAIFDVHPRTFARWLSGESESPKGFGERFRTEGMPR
jgi:transposase